MAAKPKLLKLLMMEKKLKKSTMSKEKKMLKNQNDKDRLERLK